MLIQKSSQQFPPLIIASLEPSEMPLSFRGRKKSVRPTLGENGEIKFAEFDLNQMIINNLVELENNPSPDIVRLLINEINRDITKHNILNTKVGSPGKFRIEDIFFVQVEEKLWTKITDGKANMIRVSASIEETGLLTSRKSEIPMGPRNKTLIYIFSNP